jgi:hypothetical protein
MPMHMKPKLSFGIQFEKGRPTMGLPVGDALKAMFERVNEIVDLFESIG